MKLAQILATSPLPGGVSARQMPGGASLAQMPASVSPVAAGLSDVGAAVGQLGQQVAAQEAKAAALLAQAEREKEKHQQALDASTAVNAAVDTMDQAEQTFKMGQRDETTGELTVAPLSSQEYMPAWLKLREKVTQDALAKATTPEAKLVTAKLLETPFRERQHQARKYSNDLYVGQYTVGVENNLDAYSKNAVLKPEEAPYWETRATADLAIAQGVKGPEWVAKRREQWVTEVDTAAAKRRAVGDPGATIDDLAAGKYRLPQGKADDLAATIQTHWAARQTQEREAAQRDDQAMHDSITHNRDATIGALAREASNGRLTTAQLDDWAATITMPLGPYENIRKIITEAPKDGPSDPTLLSKLSIGINTGDPSITRSVLATFRTPGGGLNQKDYEHLDGKLKGEIDSRRAEADRQTQRAIAASQRDIAVSQRNIAEQARVDAKAARVTGDARTLYHDALQYMGQQLGIPDIFRIDKTREKTWSDATDELFARAHPSNSRYENAKAVVDEIVPRFRARLGENALRTMDELKARIRWRTTEELAAATVHYNLTPEAVRQQQDLIGLYKAAKDDYEKLQALEATKPKGKGVTRTPAKSE